jgi:hypothetical protein
MITELPVLAGQVLMLDSDSLPLRNPEYLFRTPEYRGAGSLFFSDWWDIVEWVKPESYTTFGFAFPGLQAATLAAESGQVFLNRCSRCVIRRQERMQAAPAFFVVRQLCFNALWHAVQC